MARSRKGAWLRDELILALDLYVREGKNASKASMEKVSDLLRAMPIEPELASAPTFRSPEAVSYKLHNLVNLDPSDPTEGFPNGGAGDKAVWDEFASDPPRLASTAAAIRAEIALDEVSKPPPPIDDDEIAEAPEGALLTRRHRYRERSKKLVNQKKKDALELHGKLECETCSFDFAASYGQRGEGFIECHHTVPVSELEPGATTKISDLVLLCSNCHRMIHRRSPWLTVAQLQDLIEGNS